MVSDPTLLSGHALFLGSVTWSLFRGHECRSYLLGGHAAAEDGGGGEVPAVARVRSAHHVLGVPHLLSQLGHAARTVMEI